MKMLLILDALEKLDVGNLLKKTETQLKKIKLKKINSSYYMQF